LGKKVKRKTYVSKGLHSNVNSGLLKAMRRDADPFQKALNKIEAWRKGQNPWITVPGPSSNMRFIKVRANAYYGDPRNSMANIFGKRDAE
jgi:hypothetical protein